MLIINRKKDDEIFIGDKVKLTIKETKNNKVKLGFEIKETRQNAEIPKRQNVAR